MIYNMRAVPHIVAAIAVAGAGGGGPPPLGPVFFCALAVGAIMAGSGAIFAARINGGEEIWKPCYFCKKNQNTACVGKCNGGGGGGTGELKNEKGLK